MSGYGKLSVAVVTSYVFDWIVIIVAAAIGAVLNTIEPYKRPFSLYDQDISFPYVAHEKIPNALLVIISLLVPLVVIVFVCLLFVPGPTISGKASSRLVWRRKLWEWFTGWTGLALSCAAAFFITQGMKNLFGRPRPDLLSRCDADYANAITFAAGALAPGNITLRVSNTICRNNDKSIMNDGFRSFPSGHSSFSAAGLVYLSLFLASKLSITLPFLTPQALARTYRKVQRSSSTSTTHSIHSDPNNLRARTPNIPNDTAEESAKYAHPSGHDDIEIAARDQAASPPVYLLVFAAAPTFTAIYIASTRFTDFRHHAFDILFGQFIGITTAWFAFRWYHLPIRQGAGWSWGPRSKDRAFWAGVGKGVYVSRQEEEEEGIGGVGITNGRNGYAKVRRNGNGGAGVDLEAGAGAGAGGHSRNSSVAGGGDGGLNDVDIELQPLTLKPYLGAGLSYDRDRS